MKKHLALYNLYLHRNMLQLIIVSILFLFSTGLTNGIMMPCETYIDSTYAEYDLYGKMQFLCNNPVFHKFIINITFTVNMIILSLFISISTSYFFLILKNNFNQIPKNVFDSGFTDNISLLSSLPINENTLLKSIASYSVLLIIIPLLILQAPTLIRFFRTFIWTGIDLNTFTITLTVVCFLMSLIIFKLLHSPKLNILLNIFVFIFVLISPIAVPFFFETISKSILENFNNFSNVAYLFNNNNPLLLFGAIILFIILAILLKNKYKIPQY